MHVLWKQTIRVLSGFCVRVLHSVDVRLFAHTHRLSLATGYNVLTLTQFSQEVPLSARHCYAYGVSHDVWRRNPAKAKTPSLWELSSPFWESAAAIASGVDAEGFCVRAEGEVLDLLE